MISAVKKEGSQASVLGAVDRDLLDLIQQDFPVERDPWSALGRQLRLGGAEVLDRVIALKQAGVIRQISPIFDSAALGYTSMLVAARVPADRLEDAAQAVNAHPGVSHNYLREAEYNLWFTIAVPPGRDVGDELAQLAHCAGLSAVHPMPAIRTFHIGVKLAMGEESVPGRRRELDETVERGQPVFLTDHDKELVRVTQDDLPLVPAPFEGICGRLDLTIEHLRMWFERMRDAGALRRFAAILRHRATGFSANGMGVWRLPVAMIDAAGRTAAQFAAVSHCYQRPSYPDWPFNLYTMVHARTREQCEATMEEIAQQLKPLGLLDRRVIYSTREFKKQRVRYFTEA